MIDNATLKSIRERRSTGRFASDPVSDDLLDAMLEAGRWAPSGQNSQPWEFIVVRDREVRAGMGEILERITLAWQGFSAAPVMIAVAVNPRKDPKHYAEDGAIAAQNLCLAGHSLGLATSWAGVSGGGSRRGSVQSDLRKLLSLPKGLEVIAIIPVGYPFNATHHMPSTRRPLAEMVHFDRYKGLRPTEASADVT
jgi:nitroreductase